MSEPVLDVRDLCVEYATRGDPVRAVDRVDLAVHPGETVAVVGESGCGKSSLVLAVLRLLPDAGRVTRGEVVLAGQSVLALPRRRLRRIRGRDVGVVFQDPSTSLHPCHRIEDQVAEAVRAHERHVSRRAARSRARELLESVGVPAGTRARAYPHEWSGGMRQRAMIAMAVAHRPPLVVADEPTSALDVTTQAQVLDLLRSVGREIGSGLVLVTHDLGVVAETADRVVVMYAGRAVEAGRVADVFARPLHPYTRGLLGAMPRPGGGRARPVEGQPPSPSDPPAGCAFHPRCPHREARCLSEVPELRTPLGPGRAVACHRAPLEPEAPIGPEVPVDAPAGRPR